jgi:hypothetical protein
MLVLLCLVFILTLPFKSKSRLEAENVALRHQVMVLRRQVGGRVHLTNFDRLFLVQLYHWFPSIRRVLAIVRPETVVRWHRAARGGRPQIDTELRALIKRMSVENPLWGAPRIHGELLKLGFDVAQSSVAKYMVKRCGPPSQGWCTFLRNHAPDIAAMDLFVVPTIGFDLQTQAMLCTKLRLTTQARTHAVTLGRQHSNHKPSFYQTMLPEEWQ